MKNTILISVLTSCVILMLHIGSYAAEYLHTNNKETVHENLKQMRKAKKKHRKEEFWQTRETFHLFGGLLLAGATNYVGEKVLKAGILGRGLDKLDLSAQDLSNVIKLSATFYALSSFAGRNKSICRRFACRAPIAGLEMALLTSSPMQSILSSIPLGIGQIIGVSCSNDSCSRVCNKCMMTKAAVFAGLYLATNPIIDWMSDKLGKQYDHIVYDKWGYERPIKDDYDDYDDL